MSDLSNKVTLKFISPFGNSDDICREVPGIDSRIVDQVYQDEFINEAFQVEIPVVRTRKLIEIDEEEDKVVIPDDAIIGTVESVDTDKFEITIVFSSDIDKVKNIESQAWNYVANFIIDEDVPEIVAVEIFDKRILNFSIPAIKIMYHRDKYPGLMDVWKSDVGDLIDLRCAETVTLDKGEYKLIPLGFSAKLPHGYHAEIFPRSSTFKKYSIIQTNSVGIIDNSYCGEDDEWFMPVYAVDNTIIQQNDRICQMKLVQNQQIGIETVDHLDSESRGGFGSTGKGSDDNKEEE